MARIERSQWVSSAGKDRWNVHPSPISVLSRNVIAYISVHTLSSSVSLLLLSSYVVCQWRGKGVDGEVRFVLRLLKTESKARESTVQYFLPLLSITNVHTYTQLSMYVCVCVSTTQQQQTWVLASLVGTCTDLCVRMYVWCVYVCQCMYCGDVERTNNNNSNRNDIDDVYNERQRQRRHR